MVSPDAKEDAVSDRIPPDRQGRWRGQRGLGSRGPTRVPTHPAVPMPEEGAAVSGEPGPEPSRDGDGDGDGGAGFDGPAPAPADAPEGDR